MTEHLPNEQVFEGIPASPGIAFGQIFVFQQNELELPSYTVRDDGIASEKARFDQAIISTRNQLQIIQREVEASLGAEEAKIFDAHLLVLEDEAFLSEVLREVESNRLNVETACHRVSQRYIEGFERIDDPYLRDRASDIRDVTKRVLQNLLGQVPENMGRLVANKIVVTHDLRPSDSAGFERGKVLAVVTEVGSKTGHAVIMARSMRVPAVVGVRGVCKGLSTGDTVIVDGYEGLVIVHPSERTLFRYGKIQRQRTSLDSRMLAEAHEPSITLDQVMITQRVNIEGTDDLWKLREFDHDGVGLFRTEYIFLNSPRIPTEEEQYAVYREVAEALDGKPVVIRTLDIGGDKPLHQFGDRIKPEANPFLGFRAIRFCLENPLLFKAQMRAILRASAHGKVHLMYPMISGVQELRRANELLEECRMELRERGLPFDPKMPVGSMVEIPSAAVVADLLAKECDFFSIGTNDLIQYLLAIDRVNDRIAHLYEPTHPAVLRTIRQIVVAAKSAGIKVSVCGEMGGDPVCAPLLLGLGVDELSMAPGMYPTIKYLIRRMSRADCEELARRCLTLADAKQIKKLAETFYHTRVSDIELLR
jgi:phosphotransferase system enzyme I (PtsI)